MEGNILKRRNEKHLHNVEGRRIDIRIWCSYHSYSLSGEECKELCFCISYHLQIISKACKTMLVATYIVIGRREQWYQNVEEDDQCYNVPSGQKLEVLKWLYPWYFEIALTGSTSIDPMDCKTMLINEQMWLSNHDYLSLYGWKSGDLVQRSARVYCLSSFILTLIILEPTNSQPAKNEIGTKYKKEDFTDDGASTVPSAASKAYIAWTNPRPNIDSSWRLASVNWVRLTV
jgi:hypothetical protein